MEYDRSFALIEAVALVALTAWLYYLNTSSSGGRSGGDEAEGREDQNERETRPKP